MIDERRAEDIRRELIALNAECEAAERHRQEINVRIQMLEALCGAHSADEVSERPLLNIALRQFRIYAVCDHCGRQLRVSMAQDDFGCKEVRSAVLPFCWCVGNERPAGVQVVLALDEEAERG